MAENYTRLQQLLNTAAGMTQSRAGSKNDDSTDTVPGAAWFKFNGAAANNLYVNGNLWVGFGVSNEQLKIWRRDANCPPCVVTNVLSYTARAAVVSVQVFSTVAAPRPSVMGAKLKSGRAGRVTMPSAAANVPPVGACTAADTRPCSGRSVSAGSAVRATPR